MSHKKSERGLKMADKRNDLESLAKERFAFLVNSRGFVLEPMEQTVFGTSFYYIRPDKEIGVEVQMDFRDEAVRIYIVKLQNAKLPKHGFIYSDERIRISLLQLLRDVLHVQDTQLESLHNFLYRTLPRDYHFADEALVRWRDLVDSYIDTILAQPLAILFPAPPPGASPASQAL